MDHLSFVFSLLLIVSVTTTTFGSAIKANNLNGKELGALLKRLNPGMKNDAEATLQGQKDLEDQDREMSKRKGALIPRKDLTPVGDRKFSITLENFSGYAWQSPAVYFVWGKAGGGILHDPLDNGQSVIYHAQSKSVDEGIAGVLTYYIPQINRTLAVTFFLPLDTNTSSNLCNVQLDSANKKTDCGKFLKGYTSNPFSVGIHDLLELSDGLEVHEPNLAVDLHEATLTIIVKPSSTKTE